MLSDGNEMVKKPSAAHFFAHFFAVVVARLQREPSKLYTFYGGNVVCARRIYIYIYMYVACVSVRFFWLSIPLIFTLLAARISHFLTGAIKFSGFSSKENRPPLFISLSLLFFLDLLSTSVKT